MSYCRLHMRHIGRFGQIGPKRRNDKAYQRQNKEAQRLPAPQQ